MSEKFIFEGETFPIRAIGKYIGINKEVHVSGVTELIYKAKFLTEMKAVQKLGDDLMKFIDKSKVTTKTVIIPVPDKHSKRPLVDLIAKDLGHQLQCKVEKPEYKFEDGAEIIIVDVTLRTAKRLQKVVSEIVGNMKKANKKYNIKILVCAISEDYGKTAVTKEKATAEATTEKKKPYFFRKKK